MRGFRSRCVLCRAEADQRASRRHLPARLDRIGRSRGRFRKGLRDQSRRNTDALRGDPAREPGVRRRLSAARRFHLVDCGVRRALRGDDRRRVFHDAADELRNAKGHLRVAVVRLFTPRFPVGHRLAPADDLRAAGRAQSRGVRLLFRHHQGAARRQGGDLARAGHRAPLARFAAFGCRLSAPRGGPRPRPARRAAQSDDARRFGDRGRANRGSSRSGRRVSRAAHPPRTRRNH